MKKRDAATAARIAALTRAVYRAADGVGVVDDPTAPVGGPPEEGPELDPDGGGGRRGRTEAHSGLGPVAATQESTTPRGRHGRGHRWALSRSAAIGLVLAVCTGGSILALRSATIAAGIDVVTIESPTTPGDPGDPHASPSREEPAATRADPRDSVSPSKPTSAEVVVHVAGAVVAPGVVRLQAGARVADAVSAAGGTLPESDLDAVNLARAVVDGEQVYVPEAGEGAPAAAAGSAAGAGSGSGPASGILGGDPALVNLNSADAAALDSLPGIGPALSQRILDWRSAHGPFQSVDELTEVSGIGPATLERLRPLVTV